MNFRDIEHIQECDEPKRPHFLRPVAAVALAGGMLLVVGASLGSVDTSASEDAEEPLAALVAASRAARPADSGADEANKKGFDDVFADRSASAAGETEPHVVNVETDQARTDSVGAESSDFSGKGPSDGEPKLSELETKHQLQLASFKSQADAKAYAARLREQGHESHAEAAYVKGKGLWHRVRIGPFSSRAEAQKYKQKLDKEERATAFVVNPGRAGASSDLPLGAQPPAAAIRFASPDP